MEEIIAERAPTGVDYGLYTHLPKILSNDEIIVDFVIMGMASGARRNASFDINKKIDIQRKMGYGFYQGGFKGEPTWKSQAELWKLLALEMGALFGWADWERSVLSPLADAPGHNAMRVYNIIDYLNGETPIEWGIYSNCNDYIEFFKPFIKNHADIPLWLAWPDDKPDFNSKAFDKWWRRTERETWQIEQFTWKLDAQAIGATNNKQSMDGDLANMNFEEFDKFLGLDPDYQESKEIDTCPIDAMISELDNVISKYRGGDYGN